MQATNMIHCQQKTTNQASKGVRGGAKKQGGFTLIELSISIAIIGVLLMVAMQVKEAVTYQRKQDALVRQVQQIATAAERWQKGRPNKTGVSMTVLCATGGRLLDNSICGTTNDGKKSNPFGGDTTMIPNSANPSLVTITFAGLPAEYITDLADTLAPLSNQRCQVSTGCTSLTATANSLAITL